MNRMKKSVLLGLCLALALSAAGCVGQPGESVPPESPSSDPSFSAEPTTSTRPDFTNRTMRIALCTSPGTVDDHLGNAESYSGVLSFIRSRGGMDQVTPLQEITGDPASALQLLENAASYYDVLVCVGEAFSGIAQVAQANPEKYFLLVDAVLDSETVPDNLYAMSFAEQECGFFAGMVAAMESKTGYVAIVNNVPSLANTRYYYGFRSGIAYTNGNYGTTTEFIDLPEYAGVDADGTNLGGNYTGSLTDTAAGYALGRDLIAQGCDILFVAAGASGSGVFDVAKEHAGVRVIGSEVDQFDQGICWDGNVVLTSVVKNRGLNIERQLAAIAQGSFAGGNHTLRTDTGSTSYVFSEGRNQLGLDTLQILADAYPLMQDGTIVPRTGPQ